MSVTKQLMDPTDFHIFPNRPTVEVNPAHQLFGYRHSSEYLLF